MLFEFSLAALSLCLGAVVLARRGTARPDPSIRIDVAPLSRSWLADYRARHPLE